MSEEFNSIDELHERVLPALNTRVRELKKIGCSDILEDDIWNYLILTKWKKSFDLTLFDVVNDILNTDYSLILDYVKNKS